MARSLGFGSTTYNFRPIKTRFRFGSAYPYFTPLPGFFSPFPHGTGSLSVTEEYLALPDGPGGFRQDSSCPAVLRCCLVLLHYFGYGAVTLFRRTSHSVRL